MDTNLSSVYSSRAAEAGGLGAAGSRGHFDPLSPDVEPEIEGPPLPQTHLETFRTKSGPLDLEVSGSCLDPGLLSSQSSPLPHSLPALKLLEPGVNLATIKTIKGLGPESNQSRGGCNKGKSCQERCDFKES